MAEFFSSGGSTILQFLIVFPICLLLLIAAWLLYQRLDRGLSASTRSANRSRQPRLGIVDIYELDRSRQLILLRRDDIEHLLLVGGPNDVVVERNVQRAATRLPVDESTLGPDGADGSPRPDEGAQPPLFPSSFDMPVVVPSPLPGAKGQTGQRPPALDPSLLEPEDPDEVGRPSVESTGSPIRPHRRTPPPLENPRPPLPAATRPVDELAPPVVAPGDPRPVDPAILSDMTRQLEVALRRPSSAVTPPPGSSASSASSSGAPAPSADPGAAGMAATQVLSPSPGSMLPTVPVPAEKPPESPPPRRSQATPVLTPSSTTPAPPRNPSVASPPPPTPPSAGGPAPAAPRLGPTAPVSNPPASNDKQQNASNQAAEPEGPTPSAFSVEDIEKEFARLLGRQVDKSN